MDIVDQMERPIEVMTYGQRDAAWYDDAFYASSAVREVTDDEVEHHLYEPRSIIPTGQWSRFPAGAFTALSQDAPLALKRHAIVHFKAAKEELPDMAGAVESLAHQSLSDIAQSAVGRELGDWFAEWSRKSFSIAGTIRNFGAAGNYPGLLTATFGNTSARLIGLHLDSWDGLTVGQRLRSRYRACFNAGPGARWLLFAPVPLGQLVGSLSPSGYDESTVFDPAAFHLVANGAITRLAALRLLPGEGYLAATDTLFHDASTYWATDKNINLQILFEAG